MYILKTVSHSPVIDGKTNEWTRPKSALEYKASNSVGVLFLSVMRERAILSE